MPELSYAGKPLLFDQDGKIQAFLDRYQPLSDLLAEVDRAAAIERVNNSVSGDRHNLSLGVPNWPRRPPLGVNQLYWPTGASRWAIGFFLVQDSIKRQLTNLSSGGAVYSPATFTFSDGEHPDFTAELYMLAPRPIPTDFVTDAGQQLWLLPLVDERYWWQAKHLAAVELDFDSTWALDGDLDFATALGVTITESEEAAAAYGIPDEELSRAYENAALALDAVAWSTGRRFVRDPAGTCELLSAGDSEERHAANLALEPWHMIAGGEIGQWQTPETIRVCFPRLADHIPCAHKIYTVDKDAPSDAITVSGTVHVIHAAAWARRSDDDLATTPTNSSWLNTLAEKLRDDYFEWLGLAYDYTYQGCKEWRPSGHDDHVLYTFGAEVLAATTAGGTLHEDGRTVPVMVCDHYDRHITTRIVSLPANACPVQNLAQDDENVVLRDIQMAYTTEEITRAAPAECRLIVHDTTIDNEYKALRDVNNEYVTITVGAYSLNSDESISAQIALYVKGFPSGRWEPIGGNCAVRDWQTPDEESGDSGMSWSGIMDGVQQAMQEQNRANRQPGDANGALLEP